MEHFHRDALERWRLPGRILQRAIGRDARSTSEVMTMAFAHYTAEAGPMEPHRHAEECIYVVGAQDGWVEWGPRKDELTERCDLAEGMLLHVSPDDWHVFRHGEGGFIDILFVFSPPI